MRYCLINGSPRGKRGNTEILLRQVAAGIESASDAQIDWFYLKDANTHADALRAFTSADVVLIGFPLYTDAMPGMVKAFIEMLAPCVGRVDNPTLAFLVQSGFPEAHHSRFVERYLEKLARRLNASYAGTIVKGGCEGVRLKPDEMNAKLFSSLKVLGSDLVKDGKFDRNRLKRLAKPERIPRILTPLIWIALKLPGVQAYWDYLLKQNGAYEKRFARPFKENP